MAASRGSPPAQGACPGAGEGPKGDPGGTIRPGPQLLGRQPEPGWAAEFHTRISCRAQTGPDVAAVLKPGSCFIGEKENTVFCSQSPPSPLKHQQSQRLVARASSAQGDKPCCCLSAPACGQPGWRPQARLAPSPSTRPSLHQPFPST